MLTKKTTPNAECCASDQSKKSTCTSFHGMLIVVILALSIALISYLFLATSNLNFKNYKTVKPNGIDIDKDAYSAVFLSNSQVYFGKLKDANAQFMTLTDIYYLQFNPELQQGDSGVAADTVKSSDLALIKLGDEIHNPEDQMILNKDHILFIEKLKTDSNVVKAIEEDKAKIE